MKKAIVTKNYESAYPDAIRIAKDEALTVGDRTSDWPGWLWCRTVSGKRGWVPEEYLKVDGDKASALCDYDATELTVEKNEEVTILKTLAGWALCENSSGKRGWVPEGCLET